ncbi:recombinase family protein [Vibrio parahaemolyticus]
MEKVGYARVSSTGQSLDAQLARLNQVGCQRIYQKNEVVEPRIVQSFNPV